MEELTARHKKEQRDLQSQVTQKKKGASKKTRKSVNDECARLEEDLKTRQAQELANSGDPGSTELANGNSENVDLLDSFVPSNDAKAEPELKNLDLNEGDLRTIKEQHSASKQRKPNRQKVRLARRTAEQESMAAEAAEEASILPDLKAREREKMMKEIKQRGLIEMPVAANGHCMYLAMADQMKQLGLPLRQDPESDRGPQLDDYKVVRHAAAQYIARHADDFAPFLEESFDEFVHKVRDTGEWGGQLELLALAKTFNLRINVLQADGRPEQIEGDKAPGGPEAWLSYYRHGFGLGEHYNSLRKASQATPAEE